MKKMIALMIFTLGISVAHGQEVRRALPADAPMPTAPVSAEELGRFLSGQPTAALSSCQEQPAYGNYTRGMMKSWNRYATQYVAKIRAWGAGELAPRISMGQPVIYFFGGPDSASPLAFFPDAPIYVMGGLEPVGAIPDPRSLAPAALADALNNLNKSTETILSFGIFITKDMKVDLDRTAFRGVLPVIATLLALAGNDLVSINYIGITDDGHAREVADSTGGKGMVPGVKILFRHNGELRTLYYVQANVADDSLGSHRGLLKWAGSFGPSNVYLKAASYLLQEPYFATMRNFLLNHAQAVLQDDSGIGYHYFLTGGWRCWFFGSYSGTLSIFAKYNQPDLQNAFATAGAGPLPFSTGYKWRPGESNLMLAVQARAASR